MTKGTSILDDIITIEDYIRLKIERYSDEMIAVKFHVGFNTLERWKSRHRITRSLVNQTRFLHIQKKKDQGCSMKEIAAQLRMTTRHIHHLYKTGQR